MDRRRLSYSLMFCLILLFTFYISVNGYSAVIVPNDTRLDTGDNPGASYSGSSQISSDGSGHVYVTWWDHRDGRGDIYFNYSGDYGATWQTSATRLDTGDTPGTSRSSSPRISSDGNGHVYVTWYDNRDGYYDIYFNYSSDYSTTWQVSDNPYPPERCYLTISFGKCSSCNIRDKPKCLSRRIASNPYRIRKHTYELQ